MSDRLKKQIATSFVYHRPFGTQPQRYEMIRKQFMTLAMELERLCPDSRELSLAITHLEDANMWANASIARNEEAPPEGTAEPAKAEKPSKLDESKPAV